MPIPEKNIAETIALESRKPIPLTTLGSHTLFAVPDGFHVETDAALQKLQPHPERLVGSVALDTIESFVDYVNRHKTAATTIWCKTDSVAGSTTFTAIINDHGAAPKGLPGVPGWRDFRAVFTPLRSLEWKTWAGSNRTGMSQDEFAIFVDDNLKDIATVEGQPTGTEMLALATQFEITQDKRFRSAVRVQSGGVNLEYVENDDEGTIQRMMMFDRFTLGLSPFWRGKGLYVQARLKYSLREGKLKLWYELVRPDIAFEMATNALIEKLSADLAQPILFGNAAA
jgi:uncharacterized protein YfdQ (DUF2303 family)